MGRVTDVFRVLVAVGILASAGCSRTDVGPGFIDRVAALNPARFTCCDDPEKFYSPAFMEFVEPILVATGLRVAAVAAPIINHRDHPGKLTGNAEAIEAVDAQIRPFDMVLVANKSQLIGSSVPGRFTHSYTYIGTEAELRTRGLWSDPVLNGHRAAIREGKVLIDAIAPETRMTKLAWSLDVDGAVILRPTLTTAQRRHALVQLVESLGTPYDFTFAIDTPGKLTCTGLNTLAFPHLRLKERFSYGNRVIVPDDVVAQAIRGQRMRVVAYIVGTEDGFDFRNTHSLMADIAAYWGVPD